MAALSILVRRSLVRSTPRRWMTIGAWAGTAASPAASVPAGTGAAAALDSATTVTAAAATSQRVRAIMGSWLLRKWLGSPLFVPGLRASGFDVERPGRALWLYAVIGHSSLVIGCERALWAVSTL